MMELGG